MAKLKLPEQLKDWKVISPVSETGAYPAFKVVKTEFDGSKIPAVLTYVNYDGDSYNSDNVDLINEEASFVKSVLKLRGVSNYIDAVAVNIPAKSSISLYLLTTDADPITETFKDKQLSDAEIVDFGLQISEILDKLEQNNILHGNLKPENIFVDRKGKFVLGGFTAFEGTSEDPSFLAPEMESGKQPDYTTDIYSLGLIMYTMVNGGKLPFETKSMDRAAAVSRRFSSSTVPAPLGGSEKLKSVIVIAWQPENKNRWKNAGNIKNALAAIKSEFPAQKEAAKQVIVPESTEFESNVFEEFSFDETEPAPAKQETEPEQPAPVMAKGATIAASAAINSALKQDDGEKAEEKAEEADTEKAETEAEKSENPEAAETNADKTDESKTDEADPGDKADEKTETAADVDGADHSEASSSEKSDIDNKVFDDYVVQTRVFNIRDPKEAEKKDYGDFFEDDEPSMEYVNPNPEQTDISTAATFPARKNTGGNIYSHSDMSENDDREPTKRNKTFVVGIVVIVLAVLVALAGLGVLAAQNGWFPFGSKDGDTDATQATTQQVTEAPTEAPSTDAAETTASTDATEATESTDETQSEDEVIPYDIVGTFFDYAKETLEEQGFKVDDSQSEYSDEWDEGFVISMSPDSSAPVKKGSTIKIVISKGKKSSSGSSDESSSSENDYSEEY